MHPLTKEVAEYQLARGLPAETLHNPQLHYNDASGILILSFTVLDRGVPLGRVYQRNLNLNSPHYGPLVDRFSGGEFSLDATVVGSQPVVFCLASRWNDLSEEPNCDALGIVRADLRSQTHEMWNPDVPTDGRFFVSDLLACGHDEDTIFAVAGFRPQQGLGDIFYRVLRLHFGRRDFSDLGPLGGVFF